jgi:hypothetical protein
VIPISEIAGLDDRAKDLYDFLALLDPTNLDGNRPMAVIAAYMDESGVHAKAPVCVVAGYVAAADKWVSLVDSWQKVLHLPEFNVTVFHATECWAQDKEFSGWCLEKRQSLVRELSSVVLNHRVYGFAQAIDAKAYRRLFAPVCDKKIQNPYFLCLLNLNYAHKERPERWFRSGRSLCA